MRTPLTESCPPVPSPVRRAVARDGLGLGRRARILLGLFAILALAAGPAQAGPAADPADPRVLERAWHRCLREASAHQPAGQSRAGDERNALDECKVREDALVAALMAGHRAEDERTGTVWSRTWAAFVEPLTAWIGALRR